MNTANLRQNICYAGALSIAAGFVIFERTPIFLTVGMILVALSALVHKPVENIRTWLGTYGGRAMGFLYLLTILAFFYSENMGEYQRSLSQKIPFLLLPLGLASFPLTARQVRVVLTVFVISVSLAGTASLVNYFIHFQEINEQITHSKPIPIVTGINHIYFSVLLAFAASITGYALLSGKVKTGQNKVLAGVILGLLIVYLHTISARTGLLCFYSAVGFGTVWYIIHTRRYLIGIGAALSMAALMAAAVLFVPSLRNRLNNTLKDISQYKEGKEINHYSISMRIESLKTAWLVFRENPVLGVGPADLKQEIEQKYTERGSTLLPENRILPHNQFLLTACTLGIPGLITLIFFFFYPAFRRSVRRNMPLLLFLVILFASFQVEAMLERQVGIVFAAFFYMLCRQNNETVPANARTANAGKTELVV